MNEKIEKALTAFLQFRKVKGVAPRTLRDYRYFVGQYAALVDESEDYRRAALAYLSEEGLSNATLNIRHANLKAFFTWSIEEGFFDCPHPLRGLKKRPAVSRIINISNDTITRLLEQPDRATFSGMRDFALLLFAVDTGSRPSEALSLRVEHFDFKENTVRVAAELAKTRRSRSIPFSPATADAVKGLLLARHTKWDDNAPVFCTADGQAMMSTSWCHIVKGYAAKIGESISPYALRHCAALSLLRGGASAFHVQRILGHSSISMTEKYISLTLDDLKEAHARASLINTLMPPAPERYRQRKISG